VQREEGGEIKGKEAKRVRTNQQTSQKRVEVKDKIRVSRGKKSEGWRGKR